jgi:hypothetical protein
MPDTITLIAPTPTSDAAKAAPHAAPALAGIATHAVSVDAGLIRQNVDKCLDQLKQVFANLAEPSIEGWSVGTITVGLTVTAQGSVGIATAGIEAALEITFKPNG